MRRYRVSFLRTTEFDEYVFAASEAVAEEQAWQQFEERDDPEPYQSEMKLIAVEELDD
jgi:hypothetical protein